MKPDFLAVADLRGFLTGGWHFERRIRDERLGQDGTCEGKATFAAEDEALLYREAGVLRIGTYAGRTERVLRFVFPSPARATVAFPDGRPFHTLDLSQGHWDAEHLCGADVYKGSFAAARDAWRAAWRVDGPRKTQVIETDYLRLGS